MPRIDSRPTGISDGRSRPDQVLPTSTAGGASQGGEPTTILVLGPMKQVRGDKVVEESRTQRLRNVIREIAADVAQQPGYRGPRIEVVGPEESTSQVIADGILELIETAELVVFDMTSGRPNVAYEAGIVHALGLPYMVLTGDPRPPFYFQATQHIAEFADAPTFDDTRESHRALRARLRDFLTQPTAAAVFADNLLTRYFKLPIADISGPSGLASAFYMNSVHRFLRVDGYIERARRVSWSERDGARHTEEMTIGALIAIRPSADDLMKDRRDASLELTAALDRLGYALVDATIHASGPADIRDFGAKLLARRTPSGADDVVRPAVVVDGLSVIDALRAAPRIRRLEERETSRRHVRGFSELKKRRLQLMVDSFWDNVQQQATWDQRRAWLDRYVHFCPLADLEATIGRCTPLDAGRTRAD